VFCVCLLGFLFCFLFRFVLFLFCQLNKDLIGTGLKVCVRESSGVQCRVRVEANW
jgi:hypothetical protein